MADTVTPKLALTKPEIGASNDTWGNKLNENFNILDSKVLANTNQWTVTLGDGNPSGGPFTIQRLNNSGVGIDVPFAINRQSGDIFITTGVNVSKSITVTENVTVNGTTNVNTINSVHVNATGNVTASGTITGNISAPSISSSGTIVAANLQGNTLNVVGKFTVDANNITNYVGMATAQTGGIGINGGSFSGSLITQNNASGHAFQSFHVIGQFATNFGLANDGNFYMGGITHGNVLHKFITTRDGVPVTGVRLSLAGDTFINADNTMKEPHAGAVMTGLQLGAPTLLIFGRFRYLQVLTDQWRTVSYA